MAGFLDTSSSAGGMDATTIILILAIAFAIGMMIYNSFLAPTPAAPK